MSGDVCCLHTSCDVLVLYVWTSNASVDTANTGLPKTFTSVTPHHSMAGPVRQPIDVQNLERYLDSNAPEIKTPLDIKQVSGLTRRLVTGLTWSVRLWTIKSNIPSHLPQWPTIRPTKETSRETYLANGAQSRSRIPHHSCP